MDPNPNNRECSSQRLCCTDIPQEFITDKNLAKQYFRQFGKLKRLTFKPKLRTCTIEYVNDEGFANALSNSGEYNGKIFDVSSETIPEIKVKKKKQVRDEDPDWIADPEVRAELEAMGSDFNVPTKKYNLRPEAMLVDPVVQNKEKVLKLKRTWQNQETAPNIIKKKKAVETPIGVTPEQKDLINLIKQPALTVEEKYRALDARDKLIRIINKKHEQLKSTATKGTCPDMCPEKERLMRETQHQVALYEQEEGGRSMNPNLAVKQYSRSSADQEAPLPHELRPVAVLQMTMVYLMHRIINLCDKQDVNLGEWYHFLWDRTRGIRKDITQQELCCQGSVQLVEQCARFHIHCSARLVAEDPSVFDHKINTENLTKCLQTLKYMYHDLEIQGVTCPNEAEFRAYIILLNLNDGNFMWEVQQLKHEIQNSNEVKFALTVHSAIDKNNYVKFFKLVSTTSYLNACILMRYFVQVRTKALKTLLKSYSPRNAKISYPLSELTKILAFEDIESAIDFISAYGLEINGERSHVILEKRMFGLPDYPYVIDRAINVVESKRQCSAGEVVCGTQLPPELYLNHVPQNSFDSRGYMNLLGYLKEADLELDYSTTIPVEKVPVQDNLFGKKSELVPNVFSQAITAIKPVGDKNIFAQKPAPKASVLFQPRDEVDKPAEPVKPFWATAFRKVEDEEKSNDSIFGKKPQTNIFGGTSSDVNKEVPSSGVKKGGFSFALNAPSTNIFGQGNVGKPPGMEGQTVMPSLPFSPMSPEENELKLKQKAMEEERAKREELEKKEKLRKELEQKQRLIELEKQKLKEKQLLMEEQKRKEEEQRLEELRRQKLEQLRKQKEELLRKQEEEKQREIARQKEIERLKDLEIKKSVQSLLDHLVVQVDTQLREEKLSQIRDNIKSRLLLKIFNTWKFTVAKNKRKRKAMDCSPIFVSHKTLKQEAEELYTTSQDLTLKYMKRYKQGLPYEIPTFEDEEIAKINVFDLTYSTILKRYHSLGLKLQKSMFWKVTLSLPDKNEMLNGLNRMEDTLQDYLQWQDRNGHTVLIEQVKVNASQSITYCIEKQKGFLVNHSDSNGLIFIANDFNSLLQQRILENLKDFGVFVKVPIVIILQKCDDSQLKLKKLIEEKIVSDYVILIDTFTPQILTSLIEEGLIFLSSKIEKPPPLELDTLKSFFTKYLCTEIWKRANSFTKWNSSYKNTLRNPNTVIELFNEGLDRLRKIVLSESLQEYASFPEIFGGFLTSEIPDFLPCNYRYFPKFWRSEGYTKKLRKIMNTFELPLIEDKWPPNNEFELEICISKYCTKVFKQPEKPFYKIMAILLQNVDPNENFSDIKNVLWSDVIETISIEKINETNLTLNGTEFDNKSVFNQYIVVYDTNNLEEYNKSDWFYINNPIVKKQLKKEVLVQQPQKRKVEQKETKFDLHMSTELDKTLNEITNQLQNSENINKMKKELEEFNFLVNDLESSIQIHKKISSRFEENLRTILEDK